MSFGDGCGAFSEDFGNGSVDGFGNGSGDGFGEDIREDDFSGLFWNIRQLPE